MRAFIPPEQWLAREIARRLFALVQSPIQLCPDGKVLVVVEEDGGRRRLIGVSCSLLAQCGDIELQRAVVRVVEEAIRDITARVPDFSPELPRDITVNGSGTFAVGGPEGDNGLSGKKLLLDHYGPRVAIGGTAMSGKDFRKADRAGTQLAQRLALAVVRSGAAAQVTVQLVSFPDDEAPRYVRIATPERELAEAGRWLALVDCRFAVATPWCRSADLTDGAHWGWFARAAPWEALALR